MNKYSVCNHIEVEGVTWSVVIKLVEDDSYGMNIQTKVYHDGELLDKYTSVPYKALQMISDLKQSFIRTLNQAIDRTKLSVLN